MALLIPKKGGDYSNEGQVAFLNRFVQQLNLDTFYLAGNSMGGNIAWNYAIIYPNKVKKLVLLNASGLPIIPMLILIGLLKQKLTPILTCN